MPGTNLYDASKAAMRMVAIGLAGEISSFGLEHCLIEPRFFRTQLLNPQGNMAKSGAGMKIDDYKQLNQDIEKNLGDFHGKQLGDPKK